MQVLVGTVDLEQSDPFLKKIQNNCPTTYINIEICKDF